MGPPDVSVRLRGFAPIATPHYPMPADKVRFVGEPVALVVAETIAAAKDAAELVEIAYRAAAGGGARGGRAEAGRAVAVGRGAGQSVHRYRGRRRGRDRRGVRARRACRAARHLGAARHRRADGAAHQRPPSTTRRPGTTRSTPAAAAASPRCAPTSPRSSACRRSRCAVVCGDMGGNFGTRNFFYPEYALLAWAARRVGRPVKWTCERSEAFLSDYQGRDLTVEAELALDADGQFPRRARLESEQSRRPCRRLRVAAKGARPDVERLSHPGRLFPRPRRGHQHGPDDPLSQRRPARGRSSSSSG